MSVPFVQVVKNPVTLHLPTGCRKVGTSFSSEKLVDMEDYALDEPVVVVIGAMAHGKVCGYGTCAYEISTLAHFTIN